MTQVELRPPAMWPPQPQSHRSSGRVIPILALAMAAAALALAIVAFSTRGAGKEPVSAPTAVPAQTYSDEQVMAAKLKACTASKRVIAAQKQTGRQALPTGPDDALGWANMANSRTAMLTAALYLPTQIDPATPQDVKDAAGVLASSAGEVLAINIADDSSGDEALSKAVQTFSVAAKEVDRLCNVG